MKSNPRWLKMTINEDKRNAYKEAILKSGLSIYDPIDIGNESLWIPSGDLESLLNEGLKGLVLSGLPLRTRSKIVKEHVCRSLGYPVPKSFKKTQPRFSGQLFDTYIQKSNNLQVWNEELSPTRRYAIIRVDENDVIRCVKVVTGDRLAELDTTGTLTQKYQARLIPTSEATELISPDDTERIVPCVSEAAQGIIASSSPIDAPSEKGLLPIRSIYRILSDLVNTSFKDAGADQERNRGAELHKIVCRKLGFVNYCDDGRFPDIRHQLLEIKLQTSPTIDLGLVRPNSTDTLDIPALRGQKIRHCDVRYALIYAQIIGDIVNITNIYLTTGEAFFSRFPQFQGKVLNKKIQIPLPANFFNR